MNLRIGIAGIAIESSTFSPHRAGLADFDVRRGEDLLRRYDFLDKEWAQGIEWVPLLHARSLPGGAVLPEVYDDLSAEIIDMIGTAGRAGRVLLRHPRGDERGRAAGRRGRSGHPGPGRARARRPGLDLDGPARERLPRAGHGRRPDHLLPDGAARGRDGEPGARGPQPGRAAPVRAGQAGEGVDPGPGAAARARRPRTRIEPAESIYQRVAEIADEPGVLDAAVWVGYAWADEPRCRAAVVVTGDDQELITARATELAQAYWGARGRLRVRRADGHVGGVRDRGSREYGAALPDQRLRRQPDRRRRGRRLLDARPTAHGRRADQGQRDRDPREHHRPRRRRRLRRGRRRQPGPGLRGRQGRLRSVRPGRARRHGVLAVGGPGRRDGRGDQGRRPALDPHLTPQAVPPHRRLHPARPRPGRAPTW